MNLPELPVSHGTHQGALQKKQRKQDSHCSLPVTSPRSRDHSKRFATFHASAIVGFASHRSLPAPAPQLRNVRSPLCLPATAPQSADVRSPLCLPSPAPQSANFCYRLGHPTSASQSSPPALSQQLWYVSCCARLRVTSDNFNLEIAKHTVVIFAVLLVSSSRRRS